MNHITSRENEEELLHVQCAARYSFNRAEYDNYVIWACCLLATLLPWFSPYIKESYLSYASACLQLIAFVIALQLEKCVRTAAHLRNYFDSYVLDIDHPSYSKHQIDEIIVLSTELVRRHAKWSQIQMENTGSDTPPGVRNWYEVSDDLSPRDTIYECQRQNWWWENELAKDKLRAVAVCMLFVLVLLSLSYYFVRPTIITVLTSFTGLFTQSVTRFIAYWKNERISHKIEGAVETIAESHAKANEEHLQHLINERREILVLGFNHLYRKKCKQLTELYRSSFSVK